MFASVGRFGSQVLGIATRGVVALEGILEAILVLNRTLDGALAEQQVFRPLVESVEKLTGTLVAVAEIQQEHGPAVDRLDALELGRIAWEAECEGLLLKADGKLKAANNAEARERQLKRSRDKRDPFEDNGDERGPVTEEERALLAQLAGGQGEAVDVAGVAVPESPKARVLRAKWGA